MGYRENPVFEPPEDPSQKIWRYMSLGKFLRMVQTSTLHFTVAARLVDDPWEGMLPTADRQTWAKELVPMYESVRHENAVNCWHMSETESAALWKIYAPLAEGVAIQSTFHRLRNAFPASLAGALEGGEIMAGVVKYINFDKDSIPTGPGGTAPNAFVSLIHKRRFYEYERELRAVLAPGPFLRAAFEQGALDGWDVPIDLSGLIESVIVAGDPWFFEAVRAHVQAPLLDRVHPSRFTGAPSRGPRGFLFARPPIT